VLERLKSILPQKLKYRIFTAFIIMILLPFSAINIYNYQKIETMVQQKISEQSHEQLKNMQRALDDQMSIAFKTLIFLEQDSTLRAVLKSPENRTPLENQRLVEERFQDINNSFFLYNPSVYFTVLDYHGGIYTSYKPAEQLDYETTFSKPYFQRILNSQVSLWVPSDDNYVFRDFSTSPSLLSLYSPLKEQSNRSYGLARISIDYTYWFQSMLSNSQSDQEYFIINRLGEQIAGSVQEVSLMSSVIEDIIESPEDGFLRDDRTSSLINYSYLESLDWYLVNRIPTDVLFDELNSLKQNYFVTFFALMIAFVIIAFIIAHTFTRPLTFLQMKMREAVRKNLRVKLPEYKYNGEILELAQTYNHMLDDMHELIQRLKAEERKKEAIQFQMLLAQLNPHFLLNTLNTIKWIALRSHNEEIAEISISLGKLLEASLNSEIDLIHLKDEIQLTQAYVYIQKTRYDNSFEVLYDVDDSLQYAIVPKLSLQPLVENAIQHGISSMPGQGLIRIRIAIADVEKLRIEVEDNGIGIEQAKKLQSKVRRRLGIGLENIRERLRLLFKDQGQLETVSLQQGTMVRLTLPLLLSPPYEQDVPLPMQTGGNGNVEGASG
jgi:two-component system sensor histidine kinase YesM